MRALLQRVTRAEVAVGGVCIGAVERGLLILLGVGHGDAEGDAAALAAKIATLRVFEDDAGKTNLSVLEVAGAALVVSQFTLYADTRKGRRPSFTDAADPEVARDLVERFRQHLEAHGVPTAGGSFGASMQVGLVNDGPFTLMLEAREGHVA
jgi:D-tyrosyl-tRNA(Tyr) deacylase